MAVSGSQKTRIGASIAGVGIKLTITAKSASLLSSVQNNCVLQWNLYNAVSNSKVLQWNLLNAISNSKELRWNILNTVNNNVILQWRLGDASLPIGDRYMYINSNNRIMTISELNRILKIVQD